MTYRTSLSVMRCKSTWGRGGRTLENLIRGRMMTPFGSTSDAPCQGTSTLTLADGCLLLVDEGASLHPKGIIKHAVSERIRPVLVLDILDSWIQKSYDDVDGEEAYQDLIKAVNKTNKAMGVHKDKLLVSLTFNPEKGTVAFTSSAYGWGFTLTSFAKNISPLFTLDEAALRKMWLGDYHDTTTKEWTGYNTSSPSCSRGFIHFCYKPIKRIVGLCMENRKENLQNLLKCIGVTFNEDIKTAMGEELLELVMKTWLPASTTILDMLVTHLPSPVESQQL